MPLEIDATVAARLRRSGERYTGNRRALVAILAKEGQPLSIPEILGADQDMAQSSAYRNLTVLERAGVVRRVVASDEFTRFELTEDLTDHHHHLICSVCGQVEDFTLPAGIERTMRRAVGLVSEETGYDGVSHRIDLIGRCPRCA
jgi:Fur family transcriptional regulator, ferric uptake regulator